MDLKLSIPVFDAPDLEAESAFWAKVLDGTVAKDDDWHTVLVDGTPRVAVQLAPDLVKATWPLPQVPQQILLDLYVDTIAAAHEEVTGYGATLLQAADDLDGDSGFQVYADPAGHPFCLCWGASSATG